MSPLTIAVIAVDNDGRVPTLRPIRSTARFRPTTRRWPRFCYVNNNAPGVSLRDLQEQAPIPEYSHVTHSWQSSIGFAQQFGSTMALEADYVSTAAATRSRSRTTSTSRSTPRTGIPYPYSDAAHRAYPLYGVIGMIPHTGQSDYYGLQTSFTKRWPTAGRGPSPTRSQAVRPRSSAADRHVEYTGTTPIDLGGERSLARRDQRHRAVFNGIWDVAHGFQVSGIYFYGSGQRDQVVCGCDARGLQITSVDRLRLNGTIIPRQSFVGQPIHRVEMRLLQRIPLGGKVNLAGSFEVFNLLNRKNYGSYVLTESSPQFGQPTSSTNLSYAPRTVQLGFRLTF
jgi:hypothetical protein